MSDEVVDAVRRRFDGRAATYDESAMHRDLAVAVAEFVDVAPGAAVLDVATGTGLVLRALTAQGGVRPLRTAGVDVSPGMVEVARRHLPDATLVVADARRLPFPDASFDLVTCVTGLHLIPDTPVVLAQWARVLRLGGVAVTATFAAFDASRHHREHTGPAPAPYPLRHDEFRTPEGLAAAAAPHGFRLRRSTTWSDGFDTLLVAELALTQG